MTGLALMTMCGYKTNHLTEDDATAFWMEMMRVGFTGPRVPMELFADSLRARRLSEMKICEWCQKQPGALNSQYWPDTDSGAGHWVCNQCENELSDR